MMENTPISFDQLPKAVADLCRKVDYLTTLFCSHAESTTAVEDKWLSVMELSEYLPGRPAITTLYGKVQRREVPHKRIGKRLVFLRSEIDQWIKDHHCKTHIEIKATAEQYVVASKKRRKQ